MIYKIGTKKKSEAYDLKKLKTIISFGREIYDGVITLNNGVEELINLKNKIDKFNAYPKPKCWNKKEEKVLTYENANRLKGRQKIFHIFESKIFLLGNQIHGKGLKTLTSKQMHQDFQ